MTGNAHEERYALVEVCGVIAACCSIRIAENTVPQGYHRYSIRHDDGQEGIACEIAKAIYVNHWCDIICTAEIELSDTGSLLLNEDDWRDLGCDFMTLEEFMEKYPPGFKITREVTRMTVKELIEKLQAYNPEAEIDCVVDNTPYEFFIWFGGGEGCEKADCSSVSFAVDNGSNRDEVEG
jgi:hypothetical protein